MWHEARKQERLIRGMIVDYRRRAERRKDFYEKIKAEPTQFLQLHGRPCKIHLDPSVAAAVDSPGIMMPWQGDSLILIDRFDVRAHLDFIPEVHNPEIPPADLSQEERQCNYERYRILAQNNFLGVGEVKFLQQLAVEEKFGVTVEEREAAREKNEKKGTGVAIGYNYNEPGSQPSTSTGSKHRNHDDSDEDSDLEIIDVDLCIDVNKMEASQAHELNALGPKFGMTGCDLFSFLTGDADDVEHQKQLLVEEKEKAMFSGRKSRRERRAHRDKKLQTRVGLSPPSYAAPSTEQSVLAVSRSPSRTPSPKTEEIQFITSFGHDDKVKPEQKTLFADKVKINLKKKPSLYSDVAKNIDKPAPKPPPPEIKLPFGPTFYKSPSRSASRSKSRSRSRSRSRVNKSSSRSRSRSSSGRSLVRYRSQSRSRSSSRPYRGNSRSRSNSPYSRRKSSRSRSYSSDDRSPVKPAVPRYYGRKKDDKESSSELSIDSDTSDDNKSTKAGGSKVPNQSQLRSGSTNKKVSRQTLSLKEKLRKKMQGQLSRQLRLDQRVAAERSAREEKRQARRDHDMRELAIKLRRKQREMRHQLRRSSEDSEGSSDSSRNSKDQRPMNKSPSPPPPPKRIVWAKDEEKPENQPIREQEFRNFDRLNQNQIDNRQRNYTQSNDAYSFNHHMQYNRGGVRGGIRGNRRIGSEGGNWQKKRTCEQYQNQDGDSKKVKLVDY